MFKLAVLVVVLGAVSHLNASTLFNDLVINTTGGQARGIEERTSLFGDRYFSWKGIPFAEPPTGNLRFRDPVPHAGWAGIRDASEHGANCPSGGIISDKMGEEDCLTLNVYTQTIIGTRPVMVWIHGGAFILGSGDDSMYGPDFFVTQDVVYVTLNYRLGILGFLSTGDRHAPGNYAMKDMVLALKWVRDNIRNFGGDPDNVTIFGESAGGVAVHLLTLSPLARGLFHKAIAQSGTALSSWTLVEDPAFHARALADQLGVSYLNNEDLAAKLRALPAVDLIVTTPGLMDMPMARGIVGTFTYAPSICGHDYEESLKFLPRHPREIMEAGDFMDIPIIMGYTSDESLFMIREQILDPSVRDTVNSNRHMLVPVTIWPHIDPHSAAGTTIANEFWSFYMNNQNLSLSNRHEWSQFNTDAHFIYGVNECVRYHLTHKQSPLYQYVFSFDGSLNFLKRLLLLTSFPGAMHADDLGYLFNLPGLPTLPSNHAITVRNRMISMWTEFARTGTPTPTTNSLITSTWPRATLRDMDFMEIGENLVVGTHPMGMRMRLWQDLNNRFGK